MCPLALSARAGSEGPHFDSPSALHINGSTYCVPRQYCVVHLVSMPPNLLPAPHCLSSRPVKLSSKPKAIYRPQMTSAALGQSNQLGAQRFSHQHQHHRPRVSRIAHAQLWNDMMTSSDAIVALPAEYSIYKGPPMSALQTPAVSWQFFSRGSLRNGYQRGPSRSDQTMTHFQKTEIVLYSTQRGCDVHCWSPGPDRP